MRRRGSRGIERMPFDIEDVFHSLLASGRPTKVTMSGSAIPAWRPAIEVYETDEALVVLAELAGLTEEQIEVIVDDSTVTIRGERLPVTREDRCKIHTMGILYGPFAVDVYLPFPIDHDAVDAAYESGILQVRLPRAAATRVGIATGSEAART